MKGVLGVAFIISVGVCIGVGCAQSEEDEPLFGKSTDKTEPVAKADDDGGTKSKVIPKKDEDDDDDNTDVKKGDDDDDDFGSSSSSSSGGSSSSSGGSSSSSSSSSSGGLDPCKVLTCNTSKSQSSISGDTSTSARTITGAASQWFTVDVTEDNNSFSGRSLRLRATLTSPPGKNFDLFLYLPTQGGIKECRLNEESSEEGPGVDDKVSLVWGEADGSLPNGSNDTRTVTIEVREIVDASVPAVACDPTAKWTLKLEGNK